MRLVFAFAVLAALFTLGCGKDVSEITSQAPSSIAGQPQQQIEEAEGELANNLSVLSETVLQEGCSFNNPTCNASYDCINNNCILKNGCNYNNPACDLNHSCTGNQCILKTGCKYENPPCNSSQICQNNKCFEHILSSGGGGY